MNLAVMIEQIKQAIREAEASGQKMAMFHFQVLENAGTLESTDPKSFCKQVGVPESYATEFRKMLSLATVMRQRGLHISQYRV